ncbi:Fibroblast growth factor-binding protein 1 [Merluccius polli]|uniref:Fibroblast growth factor-binding protein 1 n=1 Tax=Merluccius polli TaxID=89951 RepID=A0AA47NXM8_MERPO|nr:Fibroblast growth factor-binding protein 1 [Merluccius polli]
MRPGDTGPRCLEEAALYGHRVPLTSCGYGFFLFGLPSLFEMDTVSVRTGVACVLLLACLAQHVCLSAGARGEKADRRGSTGKAVRSTTAPRGKFTTKDGALQCGWKQEEKEEEERERGEVTLAVTCGNPGPAAAGVAKTTCRYTGRPASCEGYGADPAAFWKQVARALRKTGKRLCVDGRALVKAGMCRRAPKEAHFRLLATPSRSRTSTNANGAAATTTTTTADTGADTTATTTTRGKRVRAKSTPGERCPERADKQKLGEEYCSSAWASVCSFFFTMLDGAEC